MPHPFEETLEGFGESDPPEATAPAHPVSFGGAASAFAPDAGLSSGSHYLWDRAANWVPEAETEPALVPASPKSALPLSAPSVLPVAIAEELGLSRLSTFDELNRARRKFMWENHPDRTPDALRETAHRRVATANMLLDRAYAHIERRKRKGQST